MQLNKILKINDSKDIKSQFDRIASVILSKWIICINDKPYRIREIEFYYNSSKHNDVFTHNNEIQKETGYWYFHKKSKYIDGSYNEAYKGVDITFGGSIAYGGILIRGIESIDGNEYIDGPSKVVDKILSLNGKETVKQFMERFDAKISQGWNPKLYLTIKENLHEDEIYDSPRVGLTLKANNIEIKKRFLMKSYRYNSKPDRTKKCRYGIFLKQFTDNKLKDLSLLGVQEKDTKRYVDYFKEGQKMSIDDFTGQNISKPKLFCKAYGACYRESIC